MDFTNKNLWVLFEWNGEPIYVTQTLLSTWVVMGVLIVLAVVVRLRISSFKGVPKGFQNVIETLVELTSNLARDNMGAELDGLGGYFFSIFGFILLSNYSGLFGLRSPTADLATTAALALMTFFMIHAVGLYKRRGKYFKDFLEPIPVLLPINLIGELSKPISLAFRLFGNMLCGVIIMGLIYGMLPIALRILLPDVLHVYFDILVGALQAYIFTVLSMTFVAQKAGTR